MMRLMLLISFCLLTACGRQSPRPSAHQYEPGRVLDSDPPRQPKPSDTSLARRRVIFDSLLSVLRNHSKEMKPVHGRASRDFPRHWTMLEMTDTSFVVYDPCDGDTPTITMGEDTVTIGFLWEPVSFRLHDMKVLDADRMMLEADVVWCDDPPVRFTVDVTKLDRRTGLTLWHWSWKACDAEDDRTWLMVPSDRLDLFPKIVRVCEKQKLMEHEFLPIPF